MRKESSNLQDSIHHNNHYTLCIIYYPRHDCSVDVPRSLHVEYKENYA